MSDVATDLTIAQLWEPQPWNASSRIGQIKRCLCGALTTADWRRAFTTHPTVMRCGACTSRLRRAERTDYEWDGKKLAERLACEQAWVVTEMALGRQPDSSTWKAVLR